MNICRSCSSDYYYQKNGEGNPTELTEVFDILLKSENRPNRNKCDHCDRTVELIWVSSHDSFHKESKYAQTKSWLNE